MSCWVSVQQSPRKRYSVHCTDCGIDQEFDTYNRALNECKAHKVFLHPEQISWVS